ncbi:hypothetical protein PPL_03070 [Heterostelium album PN500]|uniref:Uncharacterized protein n=1 Tax=Heterostelium pallidum (strain ATCC 26659 / Pp 5 / PN500) TaxID=670386 RepID=D3B3U9_HETP5|nr:hypothetical protein PPL_03070 [Heterostelium album PN500]EFA83997.1 hypothetical protein PPL_03070 [Heterostelium album PN500]|eukprot:XP_020436114.1 hypothetical protein PPL_03070 [Heterostelium album PN500]
MAIADIIHKTITGTLVLVTVVGIGYIGIGTADVMERRKKRAELQEKQVNEFFDQQIKLKQQQQAAKKQEEDD